MWETHIKGGPEETEETHTYKNTDAGMLKVQSRNRSTYIWIGIGDTCRHIRDDDISLHWNYIQESKQTKGIDVHTCRYNTRLHSVPFTMLSCILGVSEKSNIHSVSMPQSRFIYIFWKHYSLQCVVGVKVIRTESFKKPCKCFISITSNPLYFTFLLIIFKCITSHFP